MNFYDAWWFLATHSAFRHLRNGKPDVLDGFMDNLSVEVHRVDPVTREITDSPTGDVEVWLEAGPWATLPEEIGGIPPGEFAEIRSHDWRLDCGGRNYEDAIIAMADLVRRYYGDGRDGGEE